MLLRKGGVYPYAFFDEWEKFNENHCLKKKNFIAILIWRIFQMQITCMKKEFVKTEIKNLSKYHDLYLKSDTLPLADVLENL